MWLCAESAPQCLLYVPLWTGKSAGHIRVPVGGASVCGGGEWVTASSLMLDGLWGFPGHDRVGLFMALGAASTSRGAHSHTNTAGN